MIIVSPPFGSFISDKRTTSVLGSFTLGRRDGRGWKIAQFVLDNIMHPIPGGWRNRIGLRNPGIGSVEFKDGYIYSLVGLGEYDWEAMLHLLYERVDRPSHLELNLGCQNVHEYSIKPATLAEYCRAFNVTVKLPAGTQALAYVDMCVQAGVHFLHIGNTFPTGIGSISGRPLKAINLPAVEIIAKYCDIPIIGGGGIYDYQDLLDYQNAGATSFSLATIWFRPWIARNIISQYEKRKV